MKVGNIVKWVDDKYPFVPGIVIDTCVIDGCAHATVFWFDLGVSNHHPYSSLTTISEA